MRGTLRSAGRSTRRFYMNAKSAPCLHRVVTRMTEKEINGERTVTLPRSNTYHGNLLLLFRRSFAGHSNNSHTGSRPNYFQAIIVIEFWKYEKECKYT
jgi:hypothetical protein